MPNIHKAKHLYYSNNKEFLFYFRKYQSACFAVNTVVNLCDMGCAQGPIVLVPAVSDRGDSQLVLTVQLHLRATDCSLRHAA